MLLGNKEVTILPAVSSSQTRYLEDEHGYVCLSHGDVYRIKVRNGSREDCGVSIEIDGKNVGAWRLDAYCSGTIERSVDDEGRFTFYELDSDEATKSDLTSVNKDELGLVKVTFIPEKVVVEHPGLPVIDMYSASKGGGMKGGGRGGSTKSYSYNPGGARGCGQSVDSGLRSRSAGGTGLSGRSSQQFDRAEQMDLDYDRVTVINLRLVAEPNDEPRPLRAVSSIMSNLVPPAVN